MRRLALAAVLSLGCAPELIDLGDGVEEPLATNETGADNASEDNSSDDPDRPHDDNLNPEQPCDQSSQNCEVIDPCDHDGFMALICGETEELCARCGDCLTCEHGIFAMCSPDETSVLYCEGEPCFFREPCEQSYCVGGFDDPYCEHEDPSFPEP